LEINLNRRAEFGVWGAMTGRLAGSAVDEQAGTASAATRRLDPADLEAAVAVASAARAGGRSVDQAGAVAELIAETLAAVSSLSPTDAGRRPLDWSRFGMIIPVLAGSPGAGASVVAAALADVLQLAGRCALLVDAADPARSGLAAAASVDGPWTTTVSQLLQIRYSWRHDALVARLESRLPVISPGMVPPPQCWRPAVDPLHATVVDVGHDGWRATANPLLGAGAWLRSGVPTARPVLVVRPTRPSLRHAEQVLARLDPWIRSGAVTPPCQLVVVGTRRWPRGVVGAAGRRLEVLLASALFVPWDGELAAGGITDQLVGVRVRTAVGRMLAEWGALPAPRRSRGRVAPTRRGVA